MTFSACAYALKCLIDPDLPVNDGFYRLIDVHAPEGTVTNARWPAAVVGGWETHDRLVEVIIRALLPAFPERLMAGTKGMMCQAGFGIARRGEAAVHVLLRHVRRRLRRALRERRARRGAGARPEHRERADRGDGAELPGADPAARARRELRGPRAASAAGSGCARTTSSTARRRTRSSPTATASGRGARSAGTTRRSPSTCCPRRRRDAARLEGDGRARARRRDQRADVRRRRLRPARGARRRRRSRATSPRARSVAERARDVYRVALRDGAVDEAATAELRA